MSINIKGTPRAILNGVQDRSGSAVNTPLSAITGFNPVLYLLTQRGPEGTHDLASVGGVSAYGTESFRVGSAYYNHQTVLATEVIPYAPAHIHRVRLPGAARSVIRVSAELATCTIPIYLYDTLGNAITQTNDTGAVVPVIDGYTVGSRIILHYGTDIYPEEYRNIGKGIIIENFRPGNTLAKTELVNLPTSYLSYTLDFSDVSVNEPEFVPTALSGMSTDEIMNSLAGDNPVIDPETIKFHSTTLIPLFETEIAYFGAVGDSLAIIIDDLVANGVTSGSMWDISNFVYQLRLIERTSGGSTRIINTEDGDRVTTFTLGSSAYSDRLHTDLNLKAVTARKYNSNLSNTYTYDSNLTALQKMLVEGYELNDGTAVDGELSYGNDGLLSSGVINILGGLNANGKPYKTLRLQDSYSFGGSLLGGNNPVYGQGGSDGLIFDETGRPDHLANLRLFDEEVRRQLENFGDLDDPLLDIARYPITSLVDTGFSQETKDAMIVAYNKRPDIFAILATFRVADYTEPEIPPTPDPRDSLMGALRPSAAAFLDYPNAIKAQYLTYTFSKSADNLTTNVTVDINPNTPAAELYDEAGNYKPVLVGISVANSEWLYLENNPPLDPSTYVIGHMAVTELLSGSSNGGDFTQAQLFTTYKYTMGNQHFAVIPQVLSKVATITHDGVMIVGNIRMDNKINYDGLVNPEREIYKETDSVINITVKYTKLFAGDENVVVFDYDDSEDGRVYSGKVGTAEFTNLTATALVAFLATHGIEAEFVDINYGAVP